MPKANMYKCSMLKMQPVHYEISAAFITTEFSLPRQALVPSHAHGVAELQP